MNFSKLLTLIVVTATVYQYSRAQVVADFSVDKSTGCNSLLVNFTSLSTPNTDSLKWDLGNGTILKNSTQVQTTYTIGTFTARLTAYKGGVSGSKTLTIKVFRTPQANFITDNVKGCAPDTVNFTDLSVKTDANIIKWRWDMRDGNPLSSQNPSYRYTKAGLYDVFLTVTDANGCENTMKKFKLITVSDRPIPNFSATPATSCKTPVTVSFFDRSKGSGLSYLWDFGGSNTSTEQNPKNTYVAIGNYRVKLTVTSDFGCKASLDIVAISIGNIKASGTISQHSTVIASNDYICAGDISYQDKSDNSSILWDFGDGKTSYLKSGTHKFGDIGKSTIKLIASPGTSCADTMKWVVNIENPVAGFTFKDKACSSPDTVSFTSTSQNASTWKWTFPDATTSTLTNPSHIFTVPNDPDPYTIHVPQLFTIALKVTSAHNCIDTVKQVLTILRPTAIFVTDSVEGCAPKKINFTSKSLSEDPITSFKWTFGDGTETSTSANTVSYNYTQTGTFPANLVITNSKGCKATSPTLTIQTGKKPNTDFSFTPSSFCNGDVIQFTDKTPASDNVNYWQYSVDSINVPNIPMIGNPSYTVNNQVGVLTLKLIAGNNGCFSQKTITATNDGPNSSFTYSVDCSQPLSYTFTGVVTPAATSTFKWDFGDSNTDNVSLNPVHIYATPGNKTVTFTSFNGSCSQTISQIIRVRQQTIDISQPVSACANASVSFNAIDSNPQFDLCNDRYLWQFGDDSPKVLTDKAVMNHSYSDRNTYSVKLIATADNGCKDSVTRDIRIFKPFAVLHADSTIGCSQLVVNFTDQSHADVNPIVLWNWDLGDDNPFSSTTPGDNYENFYIDGSYNASLRVTDSNNCVDTAKLLIVVATPSASFTPDANEVCASQPVTFSYFYPGADSVIWHFGDGGPVTIKNPVITSIEHLYALAQSYNVTLEVYKYKCKSVLTRLGIVKVQKADAHFSSSDTASSCYTTPVTFNHLFASSDIIGGEWQFGDNNNTSVYVKKSEYLYPEPGKYTVSLYVQSAIGCEDTFSKTITLTGPTGHFSISRDQVCKGDLITLTITDTTNVDHFAWDIGSGSPVTGNPYTYAYKDSGVKNVGLILYGSDPLCVPVKTGTIVVSSVTAAFSTGEQKLCSETSLLFTNNSKGQVDQVWDFGDNSGTTSELNPSHSFKKGPVTVMLSVADAGGCKDTLRENLVINASPVFTIDLDKTVCDQKKIIMRASGDISGTSISWNPTTGLSDMSDFQATASPKVTTNYKATLTYPGGCFKSDSVNVYRSFVHIYPHDDAHKVDSTKYVDTTKTTIGNTVHIELIDTAYIKSFYWSPETSLVCPSCFETDIKVEKIGMYLLIVKEPNDCFIDTTKIIIAIDESNQTAHVPKAFHPGGNEKNNILYVRGRGIKQILEFKIFNRWGNVVFSTTDIEKGWDGTYQGKQQPIDTYIYSLTVEQYNGSTTTERGTILLLR